MTEKESAHPLSPAASVDIDKSINNCETETPDDMEEDLTNAIKNSVIPVRITSTYDCNQFFFASDNYKSQFNSE